VKPLSELDRARYLTLPDDVSERVVDLARRWTAGASTDAEKAKRIETHLRREYRYDLESPSGAAKNPLEDFLFKSKRGHCEFYSTAMAVLLRTQGVPTRNVTGFIGGTYNRFGRYYAVRQGDAHSWVEVNLQGRGWTRFDPTPPSDAAPRGDITGILAFMRDLVEATAQRWNRNVVGYDLKQQVGLFHSVRSRYSSLRASSKLLDSLSSPRRALLFGLGLLLAGVGIYYLRKNRKAKGQKAPEPAQKEREALRAVELYRLVEASLVSLGVPRPVGTPPLSHCRALKQMGHPAGEEALALTEIYLEVRFGGVSLDDVKRRDFTRRARALRQARPELERAA
jgi:hypothetical protein